MAPEEDSDDVFGAEYDRREFREMCELFGFDVTPPGTPEEPAAGYDMRLNLAAGGLPPADMSFDDAKPRRSVLSRLSACGVVSFALGALSMMVWIQMPPIASHPEYKTWYEMSVAEDEAVGLCMRLHGVKLLTCGCFYDWGPCDIFHPTESCAPDTNASRLCHLPLTVHKLRQLDWFDKWWALLSSREPAAVATVKQWQEVYLHPLYR